MSSELKDRFENFKESQLNLLENIIDQLNQLKTKIKAIEAKLEENQ